MDNEQPVEEFHWPTAIYGTACALLFVVGAFAFPPQAASFREMYEALGANVPTLAKLLVEHPYLVALGLIVIGAIQSSRMIRLFRQRDPGIGRVSKKYAIIDGVLGGCITILLYWPIFHPV